MAFRPKPQPGILDIEPYVPGESKAAATKVIKLAANENPFGTSPRVIEGYKNMALELHRYPDGGSVKLRSALGEMHGISPDRIVCGTGSDEIITILCRAFAGVGDEILYSEFGFLMYPLAAQSCGATPVKAPEAQRTTDLQALLDSVTTRTKILFLANPNNPTGALVKKADLIAFREKLREDILLVVDSAYAEYVTDPDYTDGKDLVDRFDNVVMLRTFSKAYGLSSLRVGWSYSSAYIADILNRVRGVFNICSPGQLCAVEALRDQDFIRRSVSNNTEQRALFIQNMTGLGLTAYPSQGNFVLTSFGTAEKARAVLTALKDKGILLRGMTSYALPDCIRTTIGLPEDMRDVVRAIREVM